MLSKRMVAAIINPDRLGFKRDIRDGRTVRALQNRGIIRKGAKKNKANGVWHCQLTKYGKRLARELRFLSYDVMMEVIK